MNMKKIIIWAIVVICIGFLVWIVRPRPITTLKDLGKIKIPSVLDISYVIDKTEVKLVNGKATTSISNSSASVVTTVFGKPSMGDLNGDGISDAVIFLTQETGGSGVFYYAAVALQNENLTWQSVGTVLLGDRIAPQSILVKDQVAMFNFADRKKDEPMSAIPSVGVTKYLVVEDGKLKQFNLTEIGEQLFSGNLIMAEGSRIFTPCGGTAHWVMGDSKAYSSLMDAYIKNKPSGNAYASVYAVISGTIVPSPTDGFGKDYTYGIKVNNLLKILPEGSCSKS
jgi:hypothetical protein